MSALRRLIRAAAERLAGRYYEGPEPPLRLAEQARIFAIEQPLAAAAEWEEFAARLAFASYRDGWVRGREARARGFLPEGDPNLAEAARRADWTLWHGHPTTREVLMRGHDPSDPLAGVPPDRRVEVLQQMAEAAGTFRIVVPGGRPETRDGISRFRRGGGGG